MTANTSADAIIFVFAMILMLFSYSDLKKCAAPLYEWVVGWWILMICWVVMIFAERLRARLGYGLGIGLLLLFYCWNFAGGIIYLVSFISTPKCLPQDYGNFVGGSLILIFILMIAFLWYGCKNGSSGFKQFFFSETINKTVLEKIKTGSLRVDQHLQENSRVDDYTLFKSELDILRRECVIPMGANNMFQGRTDPQEIKVLQQTHNNEALQSHQTCRICQGEFSKNRSELVFEFPHCKHLYHETCIMKHLQRNTKCRNCSQGVRSGLYRMLENKNSNRV
jgi:hypothetical protein